MSILLYNLILLILKTFDKSYYTYISEIKVCRFIMIKFQFGTLKVTTDTHCVE